MSKLPGRLAIAAGAATAAYFFWPKSTGAINPFETHAVKNVGEAYSAGGGSTTHLPGVATRRGEHTSDSSSNTSPQTRQQGIGSAHFDDKYADQKQGQPGAVEKAFRGAHYGNEKGK